MNQDLETHRAQSNTAAPTWDWTLRPAEQSDIEPIAELRAIVMRPDLEGLGRYDPHRVRQRFRDAFAPQHTSIVLVNNAIAGCVTLRPTGDEYILENFYLTPKAQGHGIGSALLHTLLRKPDTENTLTRLIVLQGSPAQHLYERFGFTIDTQDPIDIFMSRRPGATSLTP